MEGQTPSRRLAWSAARSYSMANSDPTVGGKKERQLVIDIVGRGMRAQRNCEVAVAVMQLKSALGGPIDIERRVQACAREAERHSRRPRKCRHRPR